MPQSATDPQTLVVARFFERARNAADQLALIARRGAQFREHTWGELGLAARRWAAALAAAGIEPGERVAVIAPNRYEWIIADLGTELARAVHVPIHASLSGQQIAWQLADCAAQVVVLSGPEQAEKLAPFAASLGHVCHWIGCDSCAELSLPMRIEPWNQFLDCADPAVAEQIDRRNLPQIGASDLCTILYTSGTTGEPKGVMLTHGNVTFNAVASLEAFGPQPNDRRLTWLPLSHVFARTCDLFTWIVQGCELVLADAPETVLAQCAEFHPTLLNGVPYFFERVQRFVQSERDAGREVSLAALFGGRLRAGIAGGAPLPKHVGEFYESQGAKLLEGYGLTETSPVISTCTQLARKLGSVGPPIPGVEVRIADDGEILTRGPHVMRGYWRRPDATAEIIHDGWLHTGDLGRIDDEGFLYITGRKKELIVTSGGKNIIPAWLEGLLTADPLIRQAVVIGDRRNFLTAILVPDPDRLRAFIAEQNITVWSVAEALAHPQVRALYRRQIDERLKVASRYEQIGDFVLIDRALSIEQGELTPTLKLRRGEIEQHFAAQIEAMYANAKPTRCEG